MFNLPLNQAPYYNTDQIANSIASNDMFDTYLEPVPDLGFVTRRRPGLIDFCDLATDEPGQGGIFWEAAGKVIAVSGGRVFQLFQDGTFTELTGTQCYPTTPVIFAQGQKIDGTPWLYMATGKLNYTTDGLVVVDPTDPNTPKSTHVGYINAKFVGNVPNTNQFLFTDVNPATDLLENDFWSSVDNPVTCETKGDNLAALYTAFEEILAWGTEGLQVFQDDGATPFVNIQGAFAEAGIEAVYSICKADNSIFALCVIDGKRCVIRMYGRTPQVVSEPIARVLADMVKVSDAIGSIISVGGLALYMLQFPEAQQTWVYDYKNQTWCRWGYWNELTGEHDNFIGQHSFFVKPWNKHLIMSRIDGKIYELSRDAFDDAGNTLVSFRRTGWIDHGNAWKRKRSDQFYIKCKAKERIEGQDVSLMLRWRDNGNPVFSPWMVLPLNPDYQGDCLIKLNRFGMYRSRQYEFRLTDAVDLVLVGATETVTELRN